VSRRNAATMWLASINGLTQHLYSLAGYTTHATRTKWLGFYSVASFSRIVQ
jgi:hypothetical protein